MINDLLYALMLAAAMLLILPLRIGVRIRRSAASGTLEFAVSAGFFAGLGGLRLQFDPARHQLYPELFGRSLPFVRIHLPRKAAKAEKESKKRPADAPKETEKVKEKQTITSSFQNFQKSLNLLGKPGLSYLSQLQRIVGGLRLRARGQVGLQDPSQTGRLFGYANTLDALLGGGSGFTWSPTLPLPASAVYWT